jgi:ABC-type transporter Mla MlaB component
MTKERRPTSRTGRPIARCPPRTVTLAIRGPLARGDLPGLFERACEALRADDIELLRCELAGVAADAVALDALARLTLAARRCGCRMELRGASAEFLELVAFVGLAEVLRD